MSNTKTQANPSGKSCAVPRRERETEGRTNITTVQSLLLAD